MLQEGVVEVLTSQVGVTSSGLYGKDTSGNVEERNIECSSTQIEDQYVLLGGRLGVETVGNGGSSGLVDDSENLETSDGT